MTPKPLLAAALLLALTTPSFGQSTDPRAAELVEESITLARQGDLEQAEAKLRQAVELAPDDFRIRFQLASTLAAQGRIEDAGPVFAEVVARDPTNAAARRGEITALLFGGRYVDARIKLEEGLTALPRDGQLAHTLARLCATAPLDKVRDGALALQLAQKVYEIKKTYETAETLAMAHAETGDFAKALEIQRGLIARAEQEGDSARIDALRERLLSYLKNEPWRAAAPGEIAMATEPPRPAGAGG